MRRDVGVDDCGLQRLEHAFLLSLPEVAGVNGDQHVGWGIGPFGLQAGQQRCFLVGNELHLHTGLGGVSIEDRLDQLIDTRGVNHHFIGGLHGACQRGEGESGEQTLAYLHDSCLLSKGESKDKIVVNVI
ncbi:hypothetical protein FQZ97_1055310 [compost metagenome]